MERSAGESNYSFSKTEDMPDNGVYSREEIVRASFMPSSLSQLESSSPNYTSISSKGSIQECLQKGLSLEREHIYLHMLQLKEMGEAYFESKDLDNALLYYRSIFRLVLGESNQTPLSGNFYNEGYITMLRADTKKSHRFPMFLTLISCGIRIAEIHLVLEDYASAIDWLEEVEVLYECFETFYPDSHTARRKMNRTLEYVTYHMKSALQLVRIFSELQNTSSAAHFAYLCTKVYPSRFPSDIQEIHEIQQQCNAEKYFRIRHPDPTRIDTYAVRNPALQVRGIWSKIIPKSSIRPTRCQYRHTWMWKGKIYSAFGERKRYYVPPGGDAWCFDAEGTRKWRRIPDIPAKIHQFKTFDVVAKVIVFENRAWFFSGQLKILRLDLETETWDCVDTKANFAFPVKTVLKLFSFVELYGDKLCVFAGASHLTGIKLEMFYFLDLKTLKWDYISKEYTQNENNHFPSLRHSCMTWVSTTEERFFLMYGIKEDDTPKLLDKTVPKPAGIFELWSYSFRENVWTRERLRGNFPCYRQNPLSVYDEKHDQLVLFGGGTEEILTYSLYATDGISRDYPYTMLGDTFIFDLRTRIWRQVVTRDFPAWRFTGRLFINDLGKIFLYGGMSFREFHLGTPGEEMKLYCFTDLWQLDIKSADSPPEEPTGNTISYFKAGCWRQCCVCKSVGTGYFRCEGSCGGKYIYCSVDCQRSSRATHRTVHGCRKIH